MTDARTSTNDKDQKPTLTPATECHLGQGLVSVVVPAYNEGDGIKLTLSTIDELAQVHYYSHSQNATAVENSRTARYSRTAQFGTITTFDILAAAFVDMNQKYFCTCAVCFLHTSVVPLLRTDGVFACCHKRLGSYYRV